jgi:exodeoxyribonuclease X
MHPCILDTETTGFEDPEPIEVGIIDVESRREYREQLKPSKPISLGAMATHHILDSDLAHGCRPSSEFKFTQVVEPMFGPFDCIIGHNVEFDWKVIGCPDVKLICTCAIARDLWPEIDSHTLGAMMYFLMDREEARTMLKNAHSAIADCHMAMMLLHHEIAQLGLDGEASPWKKLVELSNVARVPAYIDFGKHKGALYAHLPRGYKDWYYRQTDPDPEVVNAMRNPRTHDILGRPFPVKVVPKEW